MITKSEQFKKDKFFWSLLGIFILIIITFLVVSNWKIKERRARLNSQIETLTQEIKKLEKEKEQLQASIKEKGKKEFLEEVARNQLNLKKPGEEVVVVKKEFEEKEEESPKRSWWQRILDYLFR